MAYRQSNFSASQTRSSQPDFYPEKTSAQGHYEPKNTYKSGYTEFKWVEASTPKAAPAAAAAPPPPPKEQSMAIEPVEYSPEIQQAKERVNNYESNTSSAWDKAQATVQSSFIKPSSQSNASQQFDFGSNTFEAKESSKPKEQAQAAQNQMQNFISKYSQYKSR
jgi:hypothetical protein